MDEKARQSKKKPKNDARLVEALIRWHLEPLGRGLLKGLRLFLHDHPVRVEPTPQAPPFLPTGPAIAQREEQAGDLLLWVPRGLDSRLVDDLTGGYGYSHATVDCGEVDQPTGKPVMLETTVGQKVGYKFQDEYGTRPFVRIPLREAGVDPGKFCECVKSKLGQPYDNLEALTWGEVDDPAKQICSSLVTVCLPEEMRQDIADKLRQGGLRRRSVSAHDFPSKHGLMEFVSPNGLAEYFGAPKGKEVEGSDLLVPPQIVKTPVTSVPHTNLWKIILIAFAGVVIVWWAWRRLTGETGSYCFLFHTGACDRIYTCGKGSIHS